MWIPGSLLSLGLGLSLGLSLGLGAGLQLAVAGPLSGSGHGYEGCSENEFLCRNGHCVSAMMLCNGIDDCNDQSDERNCSVAACGLHEFQCSNSTVCIPKYQLCDGNHDCASGTDESDHLCEEKAMQPGSCGELEFICRSGQCIELQSACDNFPDCSDGSDEVNCNRNECLEANGKCSDYCWDLPLGYECACPTGLDLINHFICDDVDDCRNSDLCDQICVNLHGSYLCDCYQGYQKNPHTGTCQATGEEPFMIVTNHRDIKRINMNRMEYLEIADGLDNARALSLDISSSTIYWSDETRRGIFRMSIDQNRRDIRQILGDVQRVGGIAVDWIYSHIYWTDSGAKTLSLATLDGLKRKTLFSKNLMEPAAIAVDPESSFLYWADIGEPPKIEKAGLNGAGRRILVNIGIEKPTAIALDHIKKRLYWADSGLHELFYTDLNGQRQSSVFHSQKYLANPFGLAVFEDCAYWSDVEGKAVYSANKFTGTNVKVLASDLTEPRGLVVFHKLMQPIVLNWCVREHAACEYLCVPAPYTDQNYACLCPDGMIPDSTGHTCGKETNSSTPSQERGDSSTSSQERGDSSTSSQERGDSSTSSQDREDSSTSSQERGDSSTSSQEREDSGTSSQERSDSGTSSQEEIDPDHLDAVSVGIIALIVVLIGIVMCCAAVHWRMILGHVKISRCYSPVHLNAENSMICNGQRMDSVSQQSLL
ncbi:very low-density lipoprotein receptor-like isoform X3 [Scyliorhinus canicula]|uniref:very low-density lipoprotein receptor-like isoform X2 n=1 Tax=Scyliorhinus canicula TaxID=7830 RepID=UPI0018F588F9|nr:very low-density lipoprotein receptor-like isoform X2 [Scyliorhinus canicula]XP_038633062.1 very low-density lipoprotein receptor-like isoform X3 [Scyliorhinus canicula]